MEKWKYSKWCISSWNWYYGILKKDFYNKENMNEIKVSKETTKLGFRKTFVYDFLSSMRQKVNDPLGRGPKTQRN